jgi:hypothetical protein
MVEEWHTRRSACSSSPSKAGEMTASDGIRTRAETWRDAAADDTSGRHRHACVSYTP